MPQPRFPIKHIGSSLKKARAYPLLMEAALSCCFVVRLYRKTASHFSGRTFAAKALQH